MRVRYTLTALAELEEIFTHVVQHDRSAAVRIVDRVDLIAARLAEFTMIGHPVDEPDVRLVPPGRFPYRVFYTLSEDTVVILNVRHAARSRPWE
jgi:plasmid stabilization system protein ParE